MDLRLPTIAIPVRLALSGRASTVAEMFIPQDRRARLEALAEVLGKPTRFFPVRSDGRIALFAKRAITWIAVRRDLGDGEVTLYEREHHVIVELDSGTSLKGTLFDSSPAERPRVMDHLNASGGFVRLWTADEHYLINTDHIVHVTEV